MSFGDRAVTYDDGIPTTAEGNIFYPDGLRLVAPALAELRNERMADPQYMTGALELVLDMVLERIHSFHDTHREAQKVHTAYRAGQSQYCLYLRSFALAGTVISTSLEGSKPGQTLGYAATDRYFREIVKDALPVDLESVSFINTLDLYPSDFGDEGSAEHMRRVTIPSFRLLSHNWRHVVREVIRGADFVVLNAGYATAGVSYELELLTECGMAARTIVITSSENREIEPAAAGAFVDVVDFGMLGGGLAEEPSSRLAAGIRALASDDHRQVNEVEDLSKLECWVVDRQIHLAEREFGAEFLRGIPYENYVPASLAPAWSLLTEAFPAMVDEWQYAEAVAAGDEQPTGSAVALVLRRAVVVFYVATMLERYYEMAMALSTIGMAHRHLTAETAVMLACYRHAVRCAAWCGDPELAEFLSDAYGRLQAEVGGGDG